MDEGHVADPCGGDVKHRVAPLVLDVDQPERCVGLLPAAGRHRGDLLADETDPVTGQRQPVTERLAEMQVGVAGQVLSGDHRGHTIGRRGCGGVDAVDVGARVGTAQDPSLQHLGQFDVGGVEGRSRRPLIPLVGPNPLTDARHDAVSGWVAAITPAITPL